MANLKGYRYVLFIGAIVGSIGLAIYPVIISPMINPEKYKKIRTMAGVKEREH